MIRKFVLAAAAIAALGTVSLSAPTPAAAKGIRAAGSTAATSATAGISAAASASAATAGYDSCLRNRWVVNRFGDLVLRTVNVCY